MGKCPDCGTWDALERYVEPKLPAVAGTVGIGAGSSGAGFGAAASVWAEAIAGAGGDPEALAAIPLPDVEAADIKRLPTGLSELDRVLGGGIVPGSVVMLGGDPGIGKSTLLLQMAGSLSQRERPVLYVSSEESAYQTRLRAERLFTETDSGDLGEHSLLYVLAETNLARIVDQAARVRPAVLVIDSIQMIHRHDIAASPGSVTQLRQCCMELVHLAKLTGTAVIVVGHVTKDGKLAGPKLLEHLVDAVLAFEGDQHHAHRIVRSVKNRYGTTLEVGLFEMTGSGLAQVADASLLLADQREPRPGSVICPVMHGSRCLLVEVQALTATGFLGSAKRKTSGIDGSRLAMLIAVLEKHAGLRLADQDVFVSTSGGMRVVEPAADLAICLAIAGAHQNKAVGLGLAAAAEVGLDSLLRPAAQIETRLSEVSRLGHGPLLGAAGGKDSAAMHTARTIGDALEFLSEIRDA